MFVFYPNVLAMFLQCSFSEEHYKTALEGNRCTVMRDKIKYLVY